MQAIIRKTDPLFIHICHDETKSWPQPPLYSPCILSWPAALIDALPLQCTKNSKNDLHSVCFHLAVCMWLSVGLDQEAYQHLLKEARPLHADVCGQHVLLPFTALHHPPSSAHPGPSSLRPEEATWFRNTMSQTMDHLCDSQGTPSESHQSVPWE